MQPFIAVVAWTLDNRVSKFMDYTTQEEAEAHVTRVLATYPAAFFALSPGGGPRDWVVSGKTLLLTPIIDPAEPKPEIVKLREKLEVLKAEVETLKSKP